MAQGDVAVGGDTHEAKPGAAWIRLAHSLVDLLERVAHVREAVPSPRECGVEEVSRQRLKAAQQFLKPLILDRVLSLPRRRHRSEADLPESDLLEQMLVDRRDVEVLTGECDARADGA